MKILILEDDFDKLSVVKAEILSISDIATIVSCENFQDFTKKVIRDSFDLIIVDLLVPRFKDSFEAEDLSEQIIDVIRDIESPNYNAPVLALTGFDAAAEENIHGLNKKDIQVVTFTASQSDWKDALKAKIIACTPAVTYDFIIICALKKEMRGFEDANYKLAPPKGIQGLECREICIADKVGVIIQSPRMGLVSCAITTARAIDTFSPRVVAMSGICAGIKGKSNIYDVVIPEICHQHDFGKWGAQGFEPEPYNVQLTQEVNLRIAEIIDNPSFKETVELNVKVLRDELPAEMQSLEFNIFTAPTSSGSAVVSDEAMVEKIQGQHRKLAAFEMESYALYEAARLSQRQPKFFSAKSVVDDGGPSKGDSYHRVACILSAKVVYEILARGL